MTVISTLLVSSALLRRMWTVYPEQVHPLIVEACMPQRGDPRVPRATDEAIVWTRGGFLHREGLPALITFDGWLGWFRDGYEHRVDGPSTIDYRTDGPVPEVAWARCGYRPGARTADALTAAWLTGDLYGRDLSRLLARSHFAEEPDPHAEASPEFSVHL